MRLGDADYWKVRKEWLDQHMPPAPDSVGRAQGEMLQQIQDDLHARKLVLSKQSLVEPLKTPHYQEIAISLEVKGEEGAVTDWLIALQDATKFQVIKSFEYEPDRRSREKLPQVEAEVTLARWFRPVTASPPSASGEETENGVDLTKR